MKWIADRYAGLRGVLSGDRPERAVDEEFEFHLHSLTDDLIRQGTSPVEARAEAIRRFGDSASLRTETLVHAESTRREARRTELLSSLSRELRIAFRSLRRSPGFAMAAILTLGLGIGATTSIYTLLDAVVLRPLPYVEADRLIQIGSEVPGLAEGTRWGLSAAGYFHIKENARTIESMGVIGWGEATLSGEFAAERVKFGSVSASLLDVLRLAPVVGRPFRDADELPGAAPVALVSHDMWQQRFSGGDVVGRTIRLQGIDREIVGVMAPRSHLPQSQVDVWVPVALDPAAPAVNSHSISGLARLRPDATLEEAQQELTQLTARFPELFPSAYDTAFMEQYRFTTYTSSLQEELVGGMSKTLWILLTSVGLVLLIACANVANLFLVRLESRRREVAVRSALGAGRRSLGVYFLGESVLVGTAATLLGVIFAFLGMRALVAIAPPNFPRLGDVGLTTGALLAAGILGLVTSSLLGVLPMLTSSGSLETLRDNSRSMSAGRQQLAVRATLIVGQMALAVVLLAAAAVMLQSFRRLNSVELGIEPRDAFTFQVTLPSSRYRGFLPVLRFYRQLTDRIEDLDGVVAAGVTSMLPPTATANSCALIFVEGVPVQRGEEPRCLPNPLASPGSYRALGMSLRGEEPTWDGMEMGTGGVVVTQALAERFWPGEDAIGKGIVGNNSRPPYYRVVGVVDDIRAQGVDQPPTEAVFFPLAPMEGTRLWNPLYFGNVIVRTSGVPPLALLPQIRDILADLDPEVPVAKPLTMQDVVAQSDSMARASFAMLLLLIAGAMALILSAVGISGVIAYVVAQRSGEIGIRLALGARVEVVKMLVVRQSLTVVSGGILLGLAAAVVGLRLMESLLFDVDSSDPRLLGGVALVLVAVALGASYLPARRAGRVDPMQVLRAQ